MAKPKKKAQKEEKEESNEPVSMESILNKYSGKKGGGLILTGSVMSKIKQGFVRTGLANLDLALGGGWGIARVSHVAGESSTCKSSLMAHTIGYNHSLFDSWRAGVSNLEGYWDADNMIYIQKFGVDLDRLFIVEGMSVQDSLDASVEIIRSKMLNMYIYDSAAQIISDTEQTKSFEDNQKMADRASMIERLGRKIIPALSTYRDEDSGEFKKPPTAIIILNQMRTTPTSWGSLRDPASAKSVRFISGVQAITSWDESGGNLNYKFNSDVYKEIGPTIQAQEYREGDKIGKEISVWLQKNRNGAGEHKEVPLRFYNKELMYPTADGFFGFGFDPIFSLFMCAEEIGLIEQNGKWFEFIPTGSKVQGKDNAILELRLNDKLKATIEHEVNKVVYRD